MYYNWPVVFYFYVGERTLYRFLKGTFVWWHETRKNGEKSLTVAFFLFCQNIDKWNHTLGTILYPNDNSRKVTWHLAATIPRPLLSHYALSITETRLIDIVCHIILERYWYHIIWILLHSSKARTYFYS